MSEGVDRPPGGCLRFRPKDPRVDRTLFPYLEVTAMANIEVQVPKELGLTSKEKSALQKAFRKQLVETLRGKRSTAVAKAKLIVVNVRAKSQNQVV